MYGTQPCHYHQPRHMQALMAYLGSVGGVVLVGKGLHRLSARGQLINGRKSHVPMSSKRQSAGDWRGCHGQQVGQGAVLVLQLGPLPHAKPATAQGQFMSPAAFGETLLYLGNICCIWASSTMLFWGTTAASLRAYGSKQMQTCVGAL